MCNIEYGRMAAFRYCAFNACSVVTLLTRAVAPFVRKWMDSQNKKAASCIAEILIVCGVVTREVSVFALNEHILHVASQKSVVSLCEIVENRSCCCCKDTIAALILDPHPPKRLQMNNNDSHHYTYTSSLLRHS